MVAFNKNGLKQLQDEIKDLSAEEIQRFYRDYKTRKQQLTNQMNNAATTIQGAVKGYKARAKTER